MSATANNLGLDAGTDEFLNALLLGMNGRKAMMRATGQTKAEWLESMRSLLKAGLIVIEESDDGFRIKPVGGLSVVHLH